MSPPFQLRNCSAGCSCSLSDLASSSSLTGFSLMNFFIGKVLAHTFTYTNIRLRTCIYMMRSCFDSVMYREGKAGRSWYLYAEVASVRHGVMLFFWWSWGRMKIETFCIVVPSPSLKRKYERGWLFGMWYYVVADVCVCVCVYAYVCVSDCVRDCVYACVSISVYVCLGKEIGKVRHGVLSCTPLLSWSALSQIARALMLTLRNCSKSREKEWETDAYLEKKR